VTNRDLLARCFDALNGGDPRPFLDLYDPEIELFVPSWTGPDGGLYRGADTVNRWYANYFAQWKDQRWEIVEALEHGSSVAFVFNWTARGKRSDVAVSARFFVVMTISEGRLVTIVHLGSFDELLER
jgi:ketosteroid isomerase-like protein